MFVLNDNKSSNGLAPSRRQAITQNNADPFHSCIYAALVGDELNDSLAVKMKHGLPPTNKQIVKYTHYKVWNHLSILKLHDTNK